MIEAKKKLPDNMLKDLPDTSFFSRDPVELNSYKVERLPGENGNAMATCETCGNTYDKTFQVVINKQAHVFDSFECAIQRLAPTCPHCGCRIIGHGVEQEGRIFCCAHCAHLEGSLAVTDRA